MSNKRKRYRANKKQKRLEERLERNNEFGIKDPTPYEMVKEIIRNDKRRSERNEK